MSFNDCVPFIKEGTIVELISCSLNNTYSSGVEVEIAVPDSVRTVTICASFLTRAQEWFGSIIS